MGSDDPTKPLLAVIIDQLSSGSPSKAASVGIEGTGKPAVSKIVKDREAIEAAIGDLKKTEDRSRDLIQQAKEAPAVREPTAAQIFAKEIQAAKEKDALKESDKQLKAAEKKEVPKMQAAKKEAEPPASVSQAEKAKKEKSEDSQLGRKFQNIPEDAMKKQKGVPDRDDGRPA